MIFARSLAKKTVLLSDGTVVGTVYNVTADLKTGTLMDILVKPRNDIPELEKQDGLYVIPFETVKSIADYVVIDRRMLRKA
ncbi:PRC-barrel domain-containing protein [Archaeoglobus veneficus]|uniref:PRC-barrel domain protein n=1 Tax=Archaeoglobus veneficus (strain DSM 11195 / SNP6) TaxID=693661 RepID=F2KSM0_ARCVS|nr:PRC-barrel domain-containing protein [Archaeoglobus veneficus]AEA48090.1 PRC-barrel domain protein [Archaeoglobus veneficus SNP6]